MRTVLCWGVHLFIIFTTSFNASAGTFTTPGQFAVSPSGSATYSIPIQVPPGTASMAPSLSLHYDSQGGDGTMGLGWGLSGLSQISLCSQTPAQDNNRSGISYGVNNNNRFCLDGQRLIATSGTYGADGVVYRTELDSFAKIISHGTAGNGPAWFQVWTKGGQILEYGNTADSRIEAQGIATVRMWGVNKISDTKGNFLTVTYIEDNANGEAYVSRIDYTGNANATPALVPYASVQFSYQTRPDPVIAYQAGSVIKSLHTMTDVKTYLGTTTLVKDYKLAYEQNTITQKSRLKTLTECDGAATPNCLNPTTLTWVQSIAGSFNNAISWALPAAANTGGYMTKNGASGTYIQLIDMNGDGLPDLYNSGSSAVWLNTGSGFSSTYIVWPLPAAANANGYMTTSNATGTYIQLIDMNGDGLPDLYNSGSSAVWLNTGSGFSSTYIAWPLPTAANASGYMTKGDTNGNYIQLIDMNGDGLPDLYNSALGEVWLNTGSGFSSTAIAWPLPTAANASGYMTKGDTNGNYIQLIDMNGDGLPDLYNSALGEVWLNTGSGFSSTAIAWPLPTAANAAGYMTKHDANGAYIQLVDMNGDGLPDLYNSGSSAVWLNTGSGFSSTPIAFPLPTAANTSGYMNNSNASGTSRELIDMNGDGAPDLYNSGNSSLYLEPQFVNNRIGFISPGDGSSTFAITYKSLTDITAYTKDSGANAASYPMRDIQGPFSIVSSVASSDGIGGTVTTNYYYGGAKIDLSGRGFLGFRWTQNASTDTGIYATIYNNQTFPYIGLPSQNQKRKSSDNTLLSSSANTYATTAPVSGVPGIQFPYVTQTVENNYELNGGAIVTSTTTTYQYDAYGNATQVVVSSNDGFVKTTTNTYNNDTTNWFLGRLLRSSVMTTSP